MTKYTDHQIRDIIFAFLEKLPDEVPSEENRDHADTCDYSIIEDFVPGCPGWCGDILTVAFGHVGATYTFCLENGKLEPLTPEVPLVEPEELSEAEPAANSIQVG